MEDTSNNTTFHICCCCCGPALVSTLLTPIAPGQSSVRKVAHLQVVVAVKAVWGIFNNTNGLYLQVNTLLVIYKSWYYNAHILKKIIVIKNPVKSLSAELPIKIMSLIGEYSHTSQ